MFRPRVSQLFLAFLLALAAGIAHYHAIFRTLDLKLYDSTHQFLDFEPAEDILIVDIDERSMAALGAWPWSRRYHADLLQQLDLLGVHDVAFDVIFSESSISDPDGDEAFADAIFRHGGVVLPIFISAESSSAPMVEVPPAPVLYASKPVLGHVHIGCDLDAICRSVYLKEGLGSPHWPHISLALLLQQRFQKRLPGIRSDYGGDYAPKLIYRDYQNFIKLPRNELGFHRVSYLEILQGTFAQGQFNGYTAFVGSTVAGLGDHVSTPSGAVPGVVLNAAIYQQLRNGSLMRETSPWGSAIVVTFIGMLLLTLISRLSPFYFLLATLSLLVMIYCGMVFGLSILNLWFPMASLALLVIIYYPLWNWFKLQLALKFLQSQLQDLSAEKNAIKSFFSSQYLNKPGENSSDSYGVEVVTHTLRRLSSVYLFVEEHRLIIENTLATIGEAVVLAERDGTILLSNKLAKKSLNIESGMVLSDLSQSVSPLEKTSYKDWQGFLQAVSAGDGRKNIELRLSAKNDLETLEEYERVLYCRGELTTFLSPNFPDRHLYILSFSDISSLKHAERSRVDTLNFLSHDLRAPMVSILALIANIRSGRNDEPIEKNLDKIKAYAENNLRYSESILQLSRAEEAKSENFSFVDIHTLIDSAYYSAHDFAKSKDITLKIVREDRDFWVNGDAELIERAIINLITNGVKYSDGGGQVVVGLSGRGDWVNIEVSDTGPGIDKNDLSLIFSRYKRAGAISRNLGAGLGLYFVKTVAQKHQGTITVESEIGQGSSFTLALPKQEFPE